MKRWSCYGLLLALALLVPVRGTDVGRLRPVQTVALEWADGNYQIRTDTGDSGRGATVADALADLQATTPAVLYLDTADYLLVTEKGEAGITDLMPRLKKKVFLARIADGADLDGATAYLTVHQPPLRLKDWSPGTKLPCLETENGRFHLF